MVRCEDIQRGSTISGISTALMAIVVGLLLLGCGVQKGAEPDSATGLPAEILSFIRDKETHARSLARELDLNISSDVWAFFATAQTGSVTDVTNAFERLKSRAGQYTGSRPDPKVTNPVWQTVVEVELAVEAFAGGDPRYSLAFGRGVIDSIPPGSIYFGGTDPGRGLVTALSRSHAEGDPIFTLTQNALADRYYLREHHGLFSPVSPVANQHFTGLVRRLALSCLVDADHSDTARHYRNEREVPAPDLRAGERLARLDEYVAGLSAKNPPTSEREQQRLKLRQEVYHACRERRIRDDERILACDSPVGTGKTTAVMAHLLRVAAERKLRRVFVVLPFTNIIDQSVEVYRRALRLPDESEAQMESVVAAHHHRVDFSSYEARCLAARWDSPIVVTTAVQFFETLAAHDTASLRKLHQVAGSAIFVDEAHAAVPPALWPQMLRWLRELCEDWGCQLVLASGTLARFWNRPGFLPEAERREIPDLIEAQVRAETMKFEDKRVTIRTEPQVMSVERLADFVNAKPGPRLVIFNTVQSAAVFAHYLRADLKLGANIEHISTALTPGDRAHTIARVKEHLASKRPDWTLVATSCVEAGVDFSFRTAFRESWGLVNLLQIAGRASRSGEFDGAKVWDFRHDADGGLSLHPQAKLSRNILGQLFAECAGQNRQPGPDDCTEAIQREVLQDHGEKASRMEEIFQAEKDADYPQVAKLCRIIDATTQTVVVERKLIERLENPDRSQWPNSREMMLGSVQLWIGKERQFALPELRGLPGVFRWNLEYNPFLGYMAGVLPLLRAGQKGFEPL